MCVGEFFLKIRSEFVYKRAGLEDLFTELKLNMDYSSFLRLPRIPGYKCEYFGGEAVLVPRVKTIRLKYDLAKGSQFNQIESPNLGIEISRLKPDDWDFLTAPMLSAFATIQPFKTMEEGTATGGVEKCLTRTRNGQDGDLLWDGSVISRIKGKPVGAAIITLWEEVPHLTWIFVERRFQGMGYGACMFHSVISKLNLRWYCLHSTARSDNIGALLWHWRLGFEISGVLGRV